MLPRKDGIKEAFYDSYAILAIALGQAAYHRFTKDIQIVTTIMNLYETYYVLLDKGLKNEAEVCFDRFLPFVIAVEPAVIKEAARFRLEYRKKHFSYVDALGYVIAMRRGVPFLTGDDGFRELPGVLFVK